MIEKTRCDGCHGNTPATMWSDLSGCFGTSGSHDDDVWQREEKGRKSGGMSVQISDTFRTVGSCELFLHKLEQDCQIEEETLVKKIPFFRWAIYTGKPDMLWFNDTRFTFTQLQVFTVACVVFFRFVEGTGI